MFPFECCHCICGTSGIEAVESARVWERALTSPSTQSASFRFFGASSFQVLRGIQAAIFPSIQTSLADVASSAPMPTPYSWKIRYSADLLLPCC